MDDSTLANNLRDVRARIGATGVDPDSVKIVAVTKKFDIDVIDAAVAVGLKDVAENYAQEARAKNEEIVKRARAVPRWHFVGQLQRNKVRLLTSFVDVWQSVDSIALADEIAKRAPGARIFVQVDLADEPGRGGCAWSEVEALVGHARSNGLGVDGLMGVAPIGAPEDARKPFRRLRETADKLQLMDVSMGMSGDYEIAVQEGATVLRLGSVLFGDRPTS